MWEEYIREVLAATVEDLKKVTVQIWRQKNIEYEKNFEPHASGVLFSHANRFFLLTAAHIFLEEGKKIDRSQFFLKANDIVHLNEAELYTPDDEIYDIAVLEFSLNTRKLLSTKYRFLNLDEIHVNHNIILNNQYIVSGFYCSKSEINHINNFTHGSMFRTVTTVISDKKFKKENLQYNIHIGLNLDATTIDLGDSKKKAIPPLNGISGSGLWLVEVVHFRRTVK